MEKIKDDVNLLKEDLSLLEVRMMMVMDPCDDNDDDGGDGNVGDDSDVMMVISNPQEGHSDSQLDVTSLSSAVVPSTSSMILPSTCPVSVTFCFSI